MYTYLPKKKKKKKKTKKRRLLINEQYVAVHELVTDLACGPDLKSLVQMSGTRILHEKTRCNSCRVGSVYSTTLISETAGLQGWIVAKHIATSAFPS